MEIQNLFNANSITANLTIKRINDNKHGLFGVLFFSGLVVPNAQKSTLKLGHIEKETVKQSEKEKISPKDKHRKYAWNLPIVAQQKKQRMNDIQNDIKTMHKKRNQR